MTVRSATLGQAQLTSGTTDSVVCTAGADETIIVKSLSSWCLTAGVVASFLVRASSGAGASPLHQYVSTAGGPDYKEVWVVLEPGAQLVFRRGSATQAGYWVSGAELAGVAP